MPIMSFRKYAEKEGIALSSLQDRIKSGSISKRAIVPPETERNPGKHPKIDSDIADQDFKKNGDPGKKVAADLGAKKPPAGTSESDLLRQTKKTKAIRPEIVKEEHDGKTVPVVKEPPSETNRYVLAKATNEELKSRKIELEVLELEGRLVDVADVKEAMEKKIQEVRSALFTTGDKVALQILGKKDLLEVKTLIKKSINEALSGLQRIENDF